MHRAYSLSLLCGLQVLQLKLSFAIAVPAEHMG